MVREWVVRTVGMMLVREQVVRRGGMIWLGSRL